MNSALQLFAKLSDLAQDNQLFNFESKCLLYQWSNHVTGRLKIELVLHLNVVTISK